MPPPSLSISQEGSPWKYAQRSKGPEPNRPQFEILELRGKQGLDILGVTGEEQPIAHDVRLEREDVSPLLFGHCLKTIDDIVQQTTLIICGNKLDDIRDARRVRTRKGRRGQAASGLGRGSALGMGDQKREEQIDGIGRRRPGQKRNEHFGAKYSRGRRGRRSGRGESK